MDLRNRRVTSSSANENGGRIQKGAAKQMASKPVLAEKRNQAVVNDVKRRVSKTTVHRASPVRRPEITGIEREFSAVEFTDDVHAYLLSRESDFQPLNFCQSSVVTPKMRSILIDWLTQVHGRFHLFPETLHLAVSIVDCAIANMKIDKAELQLVGVASMIVAAKFEEMYVPDLFDFEQIADNAYSRRQIIRMEMSVLRACRFELSRPHSITFLRWLSRELGVGSKQHAFAKYFGEVALIDSSLAPYRPSQIAAISLFIAGRLTGCDTNVDEIMKMIDWNRGEMETGARVLSQATLRLHNQEKLLALRMKYASIKQYGASRLTEDNLALLNDF